MNDQPREGTVTQDDEKTIAGDQQAMGGDGFQIPEKTDGEIAAELVEHTQADVESAGKSLINAKKKYKDACALRDHAEQLHSSLLGPPKERKPSKPVPMDEDRGIEAPRAELEAGEVIDEGADVPVEVDAVTGEVVMASEVEEPEYALPTHFADGTPIDGTTAGIVADTDEYVDIFIPDPAPEEKVAAGPADKPRCEECHSSVGHLIGCSKLDAPAVPTGAQLAPTNEAVWVLWPDADDSIELPVGDRTRFGELVANYLNANPQISPTAAYEIIGTTDGELRDPRMVIPTEDWGGEFLLKLAVAQ